MDNIDDYINESEYIIIPNPLYDVVFTYLMEDTKSATIFISTIINEKIIYNVAKMLNENGFFNQDNNKKTGLSIDEIVYSSKN